MVWWNGVMLAAVLLLSGCRMTSVGADGTTGAAGADARGADGSPGVSYSDGDPVPGSGRLTSRELTLSGVTALDVGAGFVVQVTIGQPERATVRIDDNLADLVEARVRGDELRLGLRPGANVRNATLAAEVTVRHLERLSTGGVSQVSLDSELSGAELELDAGGASQITGAVRVERATAFASGASGLALSGQVGRLELRAAGTSALRLADLDVADLDVALTGASCATVAVRDTLAAQTSGASTLRYTGTPRIIREQASGASSIAAAGTRRDDRCGR